MEELDIIQCVVYTKKKAVLATIISVDGHAFKKEGAMMLFFEHGQEVGSISPGCIEADLRERIPMVLDSQIYEKVKYEMKTEDWLWGKSVGCGGVIQVLLECVTPNLKQPFQLLKQSVDDRKEVLFLRRFTPDCRSIHYHV